MPEMLECQSYDVRGMVQRTIRRPNEGFGGENSTSRTEPLAPTRTALSIHRPSLPAEEVDGDGSSHILTVRSYEHEARSEPCKGCAKLSRSKGASCAYPHKCPVSIIFLVRI